MLARWAMVSSQILEFPLAVSGDPVMSEVARQSPVKGRLSTLSPVEGLQTAAFTASTSRF